jgi:hypothetical protein
MDRQDIVRKPVLRSATSIPLSPLSLVFPAFCGEALRDPEHVCDEAGR